MSSSEGDHGYRAFRLAYDGRTYHGFQRQPDVPTVEGCLLAAFDTLGVDVLDGEPRYAAASRTDACVSALAQTVTASCPTWLDPAALNGVLPDHIWAWASVDVDPTFHPRHDAEERAYVYQLAAEGLDTERVSRVCERLEGTHDFANLSAETERTIRTLNFVEVRVTEDFAQLTVRAPGFLRQQVRRIASLLELVGRGERSLSFVDDVLSGEPIDGPAGIPPAPGGSLVLVDLTYPSLTFEVDSDASRRARESFYTTGMIARGEGRALVDIASRLPRR